MISRELLRIFLFSNLALTVLSGCSWDSVQHTSYETVESMRIHQCMDQLDSSCSEERSSYDKYQDEREQLKRQEN